MPEPRAGVPPAQTDDDPAGSDHHPPAAVVDPATDVAAHNRHHHTPDLDNPPHHHHLTNHVDFYSGTSWHNHAAGSVDHYLVCPGDYCPGGRRFDGFVAVIATGKQYAYGPANHDHR